MNTTERRSHSSVGGGGWASLSITLTRSPFYHLKGKAFLGIWNIHFIHN
jgi:hypothetical protein